MELGDRVKVLVRERNTTIRDIASAAGLKEVTVKDWGYKKVNVKAMDLYRLATALDTTMKYLLVGEHDETTEKQRRINDDLKVLNDDQLDAAYRLVHPWA